MDIKSRKTIAIAVFEQRQKILNRNIFCFLSNTAEGQVTHKWSNSIFRNQFIIHSCFWFRQVKFQFTKKHIFQFSLVIRIGRMCPCLYFSGDDWMIGNFLDIWWITFQLNKTTLASNGFFIFQIKVTIDSENISQRRKLICVQMWSITKGSKIYLIFWLMH